MGSCPTHLNVNGAAFVHHGSNLVSIIIPAINANSIIIPIMSAGLMASAGIKMHLKKIAVITAMMYILFFRRVFLSASAPSHHRAIAKNAIMPNAAAKVFSPITAASMKPNWADTPTIVAIMNLPGPNNLLNIASFLLSLVFIYKLCFYAQVCKEFAKSLPLYFNIHVNTFI